MFSKPSIRGYVYSRDTSSRDLEVTQFTSIIVIEKCFQHEMYCFPCHTVKQQKIAENGNIRKKIKIKNGTLSTAVKPLWEGAACCGAGAVGPPPV